MLFEQIIKAFIVGICASIPVGPISIFVIRNSLYKGRGSGFVTGLGACLTDTLYSILAIFALAFAQAFVKNNQVLILLVGGIIVTVMGYRMAFSNPYRKTKSQDVNSSPSVKDFLQAVLLGLSNPGAILVLFALMAFIGMGDIPRNDWRVAPIIISICVGSASYWFLITWVLSHFRGHITLDTLVWINRIAGMAVMVLGIAFIGDGLFKVIFQGASII